jgi:hypothetical protein
MFSAFGFSEPFPNYLLDVRLPADGTANLSRGKLELLSLPPPLNAPYACYNVKSICSERGLRFARHIFNSGSSRSRRYAERLIGSIPREGDDHIIVPGPTISSLRPASYMQYYNEVRTDLSSDKDAPALCSESRSLLVRSWVDCNTNMSGFNRQAQPTNPI